MSKLGAVPPALFLCAGLVACGAVVIEEKGEGVSMDAGVDAGTPTDGGTLSDVALVPDGSSPDASCPPSCICGDGVVDPGEDCDDGNADDTDSCLDTCQAASCGDGFVWAGHEACDDGNVMSGDGCSAMCTIETTPLSGLFAGNEGANSITQFEVSNGTSTPFFAGAPPMGPSPFTMTGLAVSADESTLYFARLAVGMGPMFMGDGNIYAVSGAGKAPTLFDDTAPGGGALNAFSLAIGPDKALYSLLLGPTRIVRYDIGSSSKSVVYETPMNMQTLGFAISPSGNLYYSDFDDQTVRRVTGMTTSDVYADANDGLMGPLGIAFDSVGRLYVADLVSGKLLRFVGPHMGSILATGSGVFAPIAVVVDPMLGDVFVANACENENSTIVRLDSSGAPVGPLPFADMNAGLACTRSLALAQ